MKAFEDLLGILPSATDRTELRRMAEQYRSGRASTELIDEMLERIALALRAARYPLPTRTQLERMLTKHPPA